MRFQIELGTTVEDRVTGFQGVVLGRVEYISGCNQALVTPKVNAEGRLEESRWFDEQRLTLVPGQKRIVLDNGATPGPDRPAPLK